MARVRSVVALLLNANLKNKRGAASPEVRTIKLKSKWWNLVIIQNRKF